MLVLSIIMTTKLLLVIFYFCFLSFFIVDVLDNNKEEPLGQTSGLEV